MMPRMKCGKRSLILQEYKEDDVDIEVETIKQAS